MTSGMDSATTPLAAGSNVNTTTITTVTTAVAPQPPPVTESVKTLTDAQQRERLLSAYTYSMEQLQLLQEQADKEGQLKGDKKRINLANGKMPNFSNIHSESEEQSGCSGCLMKFLHSIEDDLIPYKMLYLFMRGGEACISVYLSVFGLQIGFTPLQLAFIYALPLLISAFTTPLCGYFADKFKCRKEILLFALCLWVFFSLTVNMVPAPRVASCEFARERFHDAVAKVNVSLPVTNLARALGGAGKDGFIRDFAHHHLDCLISVNATLPDTMSWLSVLQVINTPWTERTEECFPQGGFWEAVQVPGGFATYGPKNTFRGWIFERDSLLSSFYAIFALLTVAMVMQGPTRSLTDTATLHTLGRDRANLFGWQRSFGNAGFAIYITLVTLVVQVTTWSINHCDVKIEISDYRITFVIFLGTTMCAIALLFAYCIKKSHSLPNDSNLFDLHRVFCKPNPCLLIPILFFLSACEGAIIVFLPFHLTTLGSSTLMVKGAPIISGVSELFLAFHLGQLIQSRGHEILLVISTVGYLLCFLAYALIPTPGGILPVEIFHGMSRALSWNVMVARLSPEVHPENLATLQAFLTGFALLGNGLGAVVGGVGVSWYGGPITFFCFSFACLLLGVLMLVVTSREKTDTRRRKSIRYELVPDSDSSEEEE